MNPVATDLSSGEETTAPAAFNPFGVRTGFAANI